MRTTVEHYDLVVCGGGMAGVCAAIAAGRQGLRVCLVQDRPVLGGNSSSEIRVQPQGAANYHAYARETGIISELLIEERYNNHDAIWTNSVWDMILYDHVMRTPGLTLHLNTSIVQVKRSAARTIDAVVGRVSHAETEIELVAPLFVDSTGDGIVAHLSGCTWMMGSEGRDVYEEPHAPEQSSADVMGSSIYFRAVDTGRPSPYTAPAWAHRYDDASFFYERGRIPSVDNGHWWMEIGVPWHTIYDAETIRHELTRHVLGVWDWIKNKDPRLKEQAANYALDWVGQVPGKRESRRVMGAYLLTEHDLTRDTPFEDEVAFGGWFIDLHTPGGMLAEVSEPTAVQGQENGAYASASYIGPYGLPLRALVARDVDNLLLAGRNVSATHTALGSVRVMGTTALMGQAAGTAAAVAWKHKLSPLQVADQNMRDVQQQLLRDGAFLLHAHNEDAADMARLAQVQASSEAVLEQMEPDPFTFEQDTLHQRRGQWIGVDGRAMHRLSLCVSNTSGTEQQLSLSLLQVDHIWDYHLNPARLIQATTVSVRPGTRQWIDWDVSLPDGWTTDRYVRLDAEANPALVWHRAERMEPGMPAAFDMGNGRMRRWDNGAAQSIRVAPGQHCYDAAQIISGVTRPHRATNLWRSHPAASMPQWVELQWDTEKELSCVELTFPGHLLRDLRFYPTSYADAQIPRDYTVWCKQDGAWKAVVHVSGNYQRQRKHRFARVSAAAVKVEITATNGATTAEVYEVRCYESAEGRSVEP